MSKKKARILSQFAKASLILLISLPFLALLLALQAEPMIPSVFELSNEDLLRVEKIILENAPITSRYSSEQQVSIDGNELNLLIDYALITADQSDSWSIDTRLSDSTVLMEGTLTLNALSFSTYSNVIASFEQVENSLRLQGLQLGRLQIPSPILRLIESQALERIDSSRFNSDDLNQLASNLSDLSIDENQVEGTLLWDPVLMSKLADQTQQLFISDESRVRIAQYYEFLQGIVSATPLDIEAISLNALIVPLFQEAQTRSYVRRNFIQENRAAFQALGAIVNNEDIEKTLGVSLSQSVVESHDVEIRLHRREDLAKHLSAIAAISSSAGPGLASLISTTKETYDARYRSGFSFSDLAANMVAVRLATLATQNKQSAAWIQNRLASVSQEDEYMPLFGSNIDGLTEQDFAARYSDKSSEAYLQRIEEIEKLVNDSPVFAEAAVVLTN